MPQLQWGGLSEHWLLKELGDMHWSLITTGLGTSSDKVTDSAGERLYASFVRLRWEATSALRTFVENEGVSLESRLSRFGSKMFFSEARLEGDGKQLRASLMSVFSARAAQDNTTLKKGSPVLHREHGIPTYDQLPPFASEYLAAKEELLQREGAAPSGRRSRPLAGQAFAFACGGGWTKEYVIDPFDDVNGVGLLYFASYPKIADRCERLFFHERGVSADGATDWATAASCVARDIYYFGNANPGDVLSYVQHEPEQLGDGRLGLSASLYRQTDRALIARIFSVKEVVGASARPAARAAGAPPPSAAARPLSADELGAFIVDFFANSLAVPSLTIDTNLNVLGVESILYAELAEALHGRYGISVSPARFFGLGRVRAIVDDLLGAARGTTPAVEGLERGVPRDDIAIVGCRFRLPGAADRQALWELLRQGGSAIGEVPAGRWRWPAAIDPRGEHRGIDRGGFVGELDAFDAAFFRLAPRTAKAMDPQQRWLLEMTWQLFEDAGYDPDRWRGSRTGVFIGASGSDYERLLDAARDPALSSPTGTAAALLANHVSYFYDLRGPSLQLDTACSSSLVALHQAVAALRRGECEAAIVGGIHLMCHPAKTVTYYQANMLSRSGACRTFDARADGYVRGEGAVLVLLRPLSLALRDHDTVLGVIKGSAVNHGGHVEGLTVPNPGMQAALVVAAARDAAVELGTVSHIEAHGTGTPLGDPIEVHGLREALQPSAGQRQACSLGTIKANVGHLEAAAGLAGLVKVLLAMEHRYLPPLAGFASLNPAIDLGGALRVCAQGETWAPASPGAPLRAGVSSFGIGGANAHVIVESPPPAVAGPRPEGPAVFVLSARTERALHALAAELLGHVQRTPALHLAQAAYTLQTARRAMEERLALVVSERDELVAALQAFLGGVARPHVYRGNASAGGDDVALLREEPELVALWIQRRRLDSLAKVWCRGAAVPWPQLHAGIAYPRLSLPVYPFEKAKHWVTEPAPPRPAAEPMPAPVPAPVPAGAAVAPPARAVASSPVVAAAPSREAARAGSPSAADLREILIGLLANQLYLDEREVARVGSFSALGVDSVLGVELAKAASTRLGRKVAASAIYTHATVDALAEHLAATARSDAARSALRQGAGEAALAPWPPERAEPTKRPAPPVSAQPPAPAVAAERPKPTTIAPPAKRSAATPGSAGAGPVVTLRPPQPWSGATRGPAAAPTIALAPLPRPAKADDSPSAVAPPARSAPDRIEALRAMVCEQLYLEPAEVGDDQPFGELGLDSVLAADFVKKVNAAFSIQLKLSELYAYPTVRALSAEISSRTGAVAAAPVAAAPRARGPAPAPFLAPGRVDGDWGRDGAITFTFSGSTSENPYLSGHWVFGRSLMPTDGYLELVYSAIGQCLGAGSVSFAAVRIYKPFFAGPDSVLSVALRRGEADELRFSVSSRALDRDEVVHVRGRARWAEPRALERALAEPPSGVLRDYSAEQIGEALPHTDLVGCYYRVRRSLAVARQRCWGQLMIDGAGGVRRQSHIAQILDGAFLFAIQHASVVQQIPSTEPCLYLPYQLEGLDVWQAPAADVVYDCRVRCHSIDRESAQVSFLVCDADGQVLLQCRSLVLRRIDEAQLARGPSAPRWGDEPAPDAPAPDAPAPGAPAPDEPVADAPGPRDAPTPRDAAASAGAVRIAVVGLSCRLPGARSAPELWDLLRRGDDPIEEIDAARWGDLSWYHADARHAGTSYSRWGGFIADGRGFDPQFFGITPFEAELMTPEQRVFLQECWNALEDGAIDPTALARQQVGVFVGAGASDYAQVLHDGGVDREGAVFVGTSQAILAARISYFLDLAGPALAVETACSSSLVAVDRAVKSLQSGECDLALAGGVAMLNTPQLHVWTSQVGMPSADGRCKTFDDGANGIVSSEGVGVVVLKRLADAERDGDPIRAVIVGSAINQDGKTNGITAPNALSQYQLVAGLYRARGIDPATIGYVETHGTGTKLGDPIEVSALVRAFRELSPARGHCALGSVKSHIGHCSHAAGVSGLLKAVLQLERGQIVPGLHFRTLNDEIDLDDSPFYIPTAPRAWRDQAAQARRAAVSSFGFSGTNAHVVLESYPARRAAGRAGPWAIVLSAKNDQALARRARALSSYLDRDDVQLSLGDLAYTLQVGRAAMELRAAMLVEGEAELRAGLRALAAGDASRWKTGRVRPQRDAGAAPVTWSERTPPGPRDWDEALSRWVAGAQVQWRSYDPAGRWRRVSLPGYPFATDPYWVAPKAKARASAPALHPLVHAPAPDGAGRAFLSEYSGQESFLHDHVVDGAKIFPGAAYLELVRAVGLHATGRAPARLLGLTWRAPLAATGAGCSIRAQLTTAGGAVQVAVTGPSGAPEYATATLAEHAGAPPAPLDLAAIRARATGRCTQREHYAALERRGFALGPDFRGVQERVFDDREVLGRVTRQRAGGLALDPGFIDGCFQVCLGWAFDVHQLPKALPFSVGEIAFFGDLPDTVWVYARRSDGAEDRGWSSYELRVVDEAGACLLSCSGFVVLPAAQGGPRARPAPEQPRGAPELTLACAEWTASAPQPVEDTAQSVWLLAPELPPGLGEALTASGRGHVQRLDAGPPEELFLQALGCLAALAARRQPASVTLLGGSEELHRYHHLSGLFLTAALEHEGLVGRVLGVEVQSGEPLSRVVDRVLDERGQRDALVCYRGGTRLVRRWASRPSAAAGPAVLRSGGVYLVTGGGGGVGRRLAALLRDEVGAMPIVVGRRPVQLPGTPSYVCDVSSRAEVTALVRRIEQAHGDLAGVFHLAGVCRDSLLLRKSEREVREVFGAKVLAAQHLDEATRQQRLDAFVLFSSIAAIEGNLGQGDYAAANAWLDAFAQTRARAVAAGQRWGKTLSINWPLWAEGGMSVDGETRRELERRWAMQPMPTDVAWQALQAALAQDGAHVRVHYGPAAAATRPRRAADGDDAPPTARASHQQVAAAVAAVVSRISKLPAAELRPDEELGTYGFDSILLTKLANELNSAFGLSLLPTVFFNHPTVARLAAHLVEHHRVELRAEAAPAPPAAAPSGPGAGPAVIALAPRAGAAPSPQAPSAGGEPIAVIGMSGRFPGSPDLETFWRALVDERELITEVPPQRWRWQDVDGDPVPYANRTRAHRGGFIDGADEFDAMFFGISPLEASLMDPQHRLLLQATYHALEDAGLAPAALRGSDTAVFVGISGTDYAARLKEAGKVAIAQFATGNAHCMAANRISYWFDWHGPSEPVDTACSSSLVALHRAVTSLRSRECALAVAGGVNLLASVDLTLSFSQAGMLSDDGRCKTFDSRADGYVRGEGVGVVVLKPLAAALASGDPIHAVIRSSAQNHGGKANTLTSPNPDAQRDLLLRAYAPLASELHRLCYIEAHGTGTALGDPIEVEALSLAFSALRGDSASAPPWESPCGLGSVKTNLGHLEAAAGIAGFIKLVLLLRHGVVPGNPHLQSANPYLRYDERAFRIETRTRALPPTPWPRMAGVSSFGFGGANAHVVVEAAPSAAEPARSWTQPALVPLSAKDRAALERQAARLSAHLGAAPGLCVHEVAYTLQVGRDAHGERALWIASSVAALQEQLARWLAGDRDGASHGSVKAASAQLAPAAQALPEPLRSSAQRWLAGEPMAWETLYPGPRPRRIRLAGYAFERACHWISPGAPSAPSAPSAAAGSPPHPLLHRRLAGGDAASFASRFSGGEAFFLDHRVGGVPVLPGAAQLEWVREALARLGGAGACELRDVVFVRPIVPSERGLEVVLTLTPSDRGYRFQLSGHSDGELQVFSEGQAGACAAAPGPARFAAPALQRELRHQLDGDSYYDLLHRKGIDYSGMFRGIRSLWHRGDEILARIEGSIEPGCALSPQLLDSAVQTAMGLSFQLSEHLPTCLPFGVRSVRIHAPLPERLWSYAQRRPAQGAQALPQLDVQIFDDSGRVLVELEGFVALPIADDRPAAPAAALAAPATDAPAAVDVGALLYAPVWERVSGAALHDEAPKPRALLVTGGDGALCEALRRALSERGARVQVAAELPTGELGDDLDLYLLHGLGAEGAAAGAAELALFRTLKQLLAQAVALDSSRLTVLTRATQPVLPSDPVVHRGSGIVGLVGALQKELPRWSIRLVDLEAGELSPPSTRALWTVPYGNAELHAIRRGRVYVKRLTPLALDAARPSLVREQGTYVILGGAGGIGRVTTRHLLRHYRANVVWLGRRPHDTAIAEAIRAAAYGDRAPTYLQCDALQIDEVRAAHRRIRETFGAVHGLFHSALVLSDRYVRSMTEHELLLAFRPKADASENLIEVFGAEPLDFLCFYSSLQSHVQAPGQGNYAAGCAYGDGLAKATARRLGVPVRIINWGYWGDVGVVASQAYRERVSALGLGSISANEGMAVLESVLRSDLQEVTAARFG